MKLLSSTDVRDELSPRRGPGCDFARRVCELLEAETGRREVCVHGKFKAAWKEFGRKFTSTLKLKHGIWIVFCGSELNSRAGNKSRNNNRDGGIAATSRHDKVELTNSTNVTRSKPIANPAIPSGFRNSKFHVTESPRKPRPSNTNNNPNPLALYRQYTRSQYTREEDELDSSGDLTCFLMISLPQNPSFASSMMPSQNVPVQTSQNFPTTFQQPHTIAQQMQTTPFAGYPANPQGTPRVLQ
ncbi:hypothetical protein K0M31_002951, partial [Melipona bicolor]